MPTLRAAPPGAKPPNSPRGTARSRRAQLLAGAALGCMLAACGGGGSGSASTGGTGGGASSGSSGAVIVVGSATPLPSGATRVDTLANVPWSTLAAGTQVLVSPGSYHGLVAITAATGTQAAPIVVAPFTAGQSPLLDDSVDIQQSAWLEVSGLSIAAPTYGGMIIRNASHHVTLSGNTISGAPIGIQITAGAGTGNQILSNTIASSSGDGIDLEVNADAADRTLVSANVITDSGTHGIELRASHYQIEHNTVSGSGRLTAGSSGIHVYSGGASEDSGDDNLVRYNASYANLDATTSDGNGIEIDQWCDGNTVSFNIAWSNDGAGIIVYDGNDNLVESNTLYANERDPGGTHAAGGADLVIGVSALQRSAANVVRDNLIVATRAATPALHINSGALANANVIGPNLYANTGGGGVVRWGDSSTLATAALIDSAAATSGNLVETPAFADATQPLADGLRLNAAPSGDGVFLASLSDRLGQVAISGWSFFGAYFTKP